MVTDASLSREEADVLNAAMEKAKAETASSGYENTTITLKSPDSRQCLGVVRQTITDMTHDKVLVDDSDSPYVVSAYMTHAQAVEFVKRMGYQDGVSINTAFRTKEDDFDTKSMFYIRIE